jgi:hypothetical protein
MAARRPQLILNKAPRSLSEHFVAELGFAEATLEKMPISTDLTSKGIDLTSDTASDSDLDKIVPTINLAIISTQFPALFSAILFTLHWTLNRSSNIANNTGSLCALLA